MGLIDKVNVEVNGSSDLLSTLSTYTTKILKPNIIDGKNILTQAMISSKNTKYVIKYDYELEEDITIPENCVLEFDGGSISGEYTLTCNNTFIEAGLVKIFGTNLTIAGTWNIAEAYPEWFGAKGDGTSDDTNAFQKTLDTFGIINLQGKTYRIYTLNVFNKDVILIGENGTIIKTLWTTGSPQNEFFSSESRGESIQNILANHFILDNIHFDGNSDNFELSSMSGAKFCSVMKQNVKFAKVTNCSFTNFVTDGLYLSATDEVSIENCTFKNIGVSQGGSKNAITITDYVWNVPTGKPIKNNVKSVSIRSCIFDDVLEETVRLDCCANLDFSNNYIKDNGEYMIEAFQDDIENDWVWNIHGNVINGLHSRVINFDHTGGNPDGPGTKIFRMSKHGILNIYNNHFSELGKRNAKMTKQVDANGFVLCNYSDIEESGEIINNPVKLDINIYNNKIFYSNEVPLTSNRYKSIDLRNINSLLFKNNIIKDYLYNGATFSLFNINQSRLYDNIIEKNSEHDYYLIFDVRSTKTEICDLLYVYNNKIIVENNRTVSRIERLQICDYRNNILKHNDVLTIPPALIYDGNNSDTNRYLAKEIILINNNVCANFLINNGYDKKVDVLICYNNNLFETYNTYFYKLVQNLTPQKVFENGNLFESLTDVRIVKNIGNTQSRPTSNVFVGYQYFDTDLNKPIYVKTTSGTITWVDATGTAV